MKSRFPSFAVVVSALVLLAGTGCRHSTELGTAVPQAVGLSASKLAAVDDAMKRQIADGDIVGGVVLVARQGRVIHLEAFGQRDTEPAAPMQTDTIFRIYSMTKPVATAAAMILVDEGKLHPDDPVTKFVPELAGVKVAVGDERVDPKRPMTVADLMRHTAGFSYGFLGHPIDPLYNEVQPLGAHDLDEMAERLAKLPLADHPGDTWLYSLSVDVLGLVVQRASGQPFDVFLQERLFDPLDMKDTGFFCPPEKLHRFAAVYEPGEDGLARQQGGDRFIEPPTLISGGGGLVSTARDYAHFLMMVRNGGELFGHRILKPETVALMTHDQLPPAAFPIGFGQPDPGVGFGFGFSVVVEPNPGVPDRPVGQFGWSGAASTHAWVSPADDLFVITLEQRQPYSNATADLIRPLVYDALADR